MMNKLCFGCGAKPKLVNREEAVTMRGIQIMYVAEFYKCEECGLEFELPGMLDRNLESARKAFDGFRKRSK